MTALAYPRRTDPRRFFARHALVRLCAAMAMLALAAGARAETEGPNAPNPENVLTRNPIMEQLDRVMQPASAMAAPRAERRMKRTRGVRPETKRRPPVSAAPELPVRVEQPFWPSLYSAATTVTSPASVKTERETQAETDEGVVFANELSDIDLAAKPPAETSAVAATDGRAGADVAPLRSEDSRFAPLVEAARAALQAAWMEPVLMLLAGAFAALSAVRLFA